MAKKGSKKVKPEKVKSPPGFDLKKWHGIQIWECQCGFDAMSEGEANQHYSAHHKPASMLKVSEILDENGKPIVTKE